MPENEKEGRRQDDKSCLFSYEPLQKEKSMDKFGVFMAGLVTGVIALGVTAALVEGWDSPSSPIRQNSDGNNGNPDDYETEESADYIQQIEA